MLTAIEEGRIDDYIRVSAQLEEDAAVMREALALCTECHYPLVGTEIGFQYCPYERAGEHAKLERARAAVKAALSVLPLRQSRSALTELLPKESSEQELASDHGRSKRRGAGKH